jgi:4-amino-4-deoxy-L-arabinose transferase-like glycosyltransferase
MISPEGTDSARRWRREPQLALLVLVVVGIYFTRLTALTIRGEESRRARVAVEILENNDWIVPRQQNQIYLSRPPLGSYPIALLGMLRGKVDALAIRLPTVTAVLLTTVLIYGYSRGFLSANGALASGLVFATMGQVLEIGRLAETEATFTLLVGCSLLLWHWGYSRGWTPALTWSVGYLFCALAGLAKGPQGPVYFVAVTAVYLLACRDWRMLFGRSHVVGMATFALVLGAWQIPYYFATNLDSSIGIWVNNAAQRFEDNHRPSTLLSHLATYPLEVLTCLLPWSLLLVRYADRRFLASLGTARNPVVFLVTAIAVTFPSVWLASTAKGRYFMPLYPCFALLVGVVLERALAADPFSYLRTVWRRFSVLISGLLVAFAGIVAVASWTGVVKLQPIAQTPWFATFYLASMGLGLLIVWRTADRRAMIGLVTLCCLLGITYTGAVLNLRIRASNDAAPAVADVKQLIPAGEQLVSFGRIDHLFAYLYEQPIVYHDVPKSSDEVATDFHYFCVDKEWFGDQELPFAWEAVATVALDRNHSDKTRRHVIVGRRVDAMAEQTAPKLSNHRQGR